MKRITTNQLSKAIAIFVLGAIFIISLIYANSGNPDNNNTDGSSYIKYASAKVLNVISDDTTADETTEGVLRGSQEIEIQITQGEHKNEIITVTNYISAIHNIIAKKGTSIIVRIDTYSLSDYNVSLYSYNRLPILCAMIFLFILLLCVIGGKKGFMAMLSLVFTLICVIYLLLPLLLKGFPVMETTIFLIVLTTLVSFVFIDGINVKTICAASGTIAGVLLSGILASAVGYFGHVNGFQMEEAESLLIIGSDTGLKIKNLFVAGILIASLGAVMDVAMSIASSVHELHKVNLRMSSAELFHSGMNIGKDAMGTMANTLILAFTGSSLNILITLFSYGIPFIQLVNTDLIAVEFIRGIAGSVGIVLTVPLVAFLSSQIEVRASIQKKEGKRK